MSTKIWHKLFGGSVGKGTSTSRSRILNPERTYIGDNSFIGTDAIITAHVYEGNQLYLKKIEIGNNVTIEHKAIILPGVVINDNVTVRVNEIVPKNKVIPPDITWVNGKMIPK